MILTTKEYGFRRYVYYLTRVQRERGSDSSYSMRKEHIQLQTKIHSNAIQIIPKAVETKKYLHGLITIQEQNTLNKWKMDCILEIIEHFLNKNNKYLYVHPTGRK